MTFTYTVTAADWGRIAPELILAIAALLVMLVDLLLPQPGNNPKASKLTKFVGAGARLSGSIPFGGTLVVALLGIAGAFIATIVLFQSGDQPGDLTAFNQMIGADFWSLYAYIIILSAAALGLLLSPAYLKRLNLIHQGEYYALMLFATIGMMLMAAATSFLMVFLGLEMLSLALYILCGFITHRKGSQESSMKYFLLSSFASAFLLYGIALTYGATGSTSFFGIRTFLEKFAHSSSLLLVAMGLLIVGFAFKVSAIPFQAWTPDVYDGAPAPVTAFMSVGTKAAALIAFARVFDVVLFPLKPGWLPVVWAITILTIVGGNILALAQSNLKRLLAYSSIAHAGYLLIGVIAGYSFGLSAILFYLLCYTFLNLGAFGIVSLLERTDNSGSDYREMRGWWYRQPVLSGLLAFFMLALAGFPPMSGFAAKYYIFYAALQTGHPELLILGVLASVLGIYYYLRVIATMFMEQEVASPVPIPAAPSPALEQQISAQRSTTGRPTSRDRATAVAIKSKITTAVGETKRATTAVEKPQSAGIGGLSWLALAVATLGTLAMGTVLPFWLIGLAQQAAQMILR